MLWPAALAQDLSKYREFQLGADLATIAGQTGRSVIQATVVHSRPVLMQSLSWRPQPLGPSATTEAAQEVDFHFYDGVLSRIVVAYDRHETEGLTADDMIESLSARYGVASRSAVPAVAPESFSDREEPLARWEDPQYRFELVRFSYGPSYRLIGTLRKLAPLVLAADQEAKRLDDLEAPQREAARIANEQVAAKSISEQARQKNKAKFRP